MLFFLTWKFCLTILCNEAACENLKGFLVEIMLRQETVHAILEKEDCRHAPAIYRELPQIPKSFTLAFYIRAAV